MISKRFESNIKYISKQRSFNSKQQFYLIFNYWQWKLSKKKKKSNKSDKCENSENLEILMWNISIEIKELKRISKVKKLLSSK